MKHLLAATFLLLFSCIAYSQPVTNKDSLFRETVKAEAEKMVRLLIDKDYKAFTKYTYPPLVKMLGSEAGMVDVLVKTFRSIDAEGFTVSKVSIGDVSAILHIKTLLQCTIVQVLEMTHEKGTLVSKSSLIGLSSDQGTTWTFLDTQGKPLNKLQATFKELSNNLVIPPKEQPVMVPHEQK